MEMNETIRILQEKIHKSKFTLVISGAGISNAAGIGDLQHMNLADGLQINSLGILRKFPEHYYRLLQKAFLNVMFHGSPTLTHKKLAEYEQRNLIHGIITTNIDCLHTIAGNRNVAEIQGSFAFNRCLQCGKEVNDMRIWNAGKAPKCPECGGLLAPYPVYSRLSLLPEEVVKARQWCMQAELVIVIGANGCYGNAYFDHIRRSAGFVQINPKPTCFDDISVLNIKEKADDVFALSD